jgi:hypothetical protein
VVEMCNLDLRERMQSRGYELVGLSGKSCGNGPIQVRCGQLRGAASRYHTSGGAWLTGRGDQSRTVWPGLSTAIDSPRKSE